MPKLNDVAKNQLIERFGNKEYVNFEKAERIIYSHDMGSLPQIVDKMIDTVPEAVVRVRNVEDIQFLVNFSNQYLIPLTPRGNATSGYGDSMPFGKGISVDFMSMRKVIEINTDKLTVTVEPGVVFWLLEKELNKKNLSLRVYPSSAPGATVAGWVSEGGSGIGSYRYGFFKDNIVSVEAILMDGSLKTFSGNDLSLIYATQGTIGLITKITMKIRPKTEMKTLLLHFPTIENEVSFINKVNQTDFLLFSIQSFWGEGLERRIKALKKSKGSFYSIYHNQANSEKINLDAIQCNETGIYLLTTFEGSTISKDFLALVAEEKGTIEDDSLALFLWDERFYPMREKRLGPSLIPSEAIVSIDLLPKVLTDAKNQIKDFSFEGTMVNHNEMVLLGFVLHDERTFAFSVDYVKSLVLMDIIEKAGGRLYQVGIFFTDKANSIKGKEIMDRLRDYKKQIDPKNLLNPGKLFPSNAVPSFVKLAMKAANSGKSVALMVSGFLSKNPGVSKKLAEDLVNEAFVCAQCGYCKVVCSEYMGKGWESSAPRGKFYFLREYIRGNKEFSNYLKDEFLLCTTCKRCNNVCQVNIPIQEKWDDMRGFLVQEKGMPTFPAFEMMGGSYEQELNIWTGRKAERGDWVTKDIQIDTTQPLNYWAGCTASFVETDIGLNSVRILQKGGIKFNFLGKEESCCGIPFAMAGKWDLFEKVINYNVKKFNEKKIKQVVTSCPGCWVALNHYYRDWTKKMGLPYDIEVIHITQVAAQLLKEGKIKVQPNNEKITYHDPCHIGRHGGIYEQPREILKAIAGDNFVEMEHNRKDSLCCGSVLTRISEPTVSDKIAGFRLQEATDVGAKKIITNCPCCEFQLRVAGKSIGNDIDVVDIATYLTNAMGFTDSPDPNPQVHYMWGVFLKAIQMMTPEGIIEMMKGMFPEMILAMPPIFTSMIKMVIRLPKSLRKPMAKMFRVMLPTLMPLLLPGMLPKLVPTVGAAMEKGIPDMPPSMKEMMPKILPGVLDRVMKGVLSEVSPGIAKEFEIYLMSQ
jgi:Fe-S oxidoreductase/FAD/FMN-containing dehydrogenase